MKIFVLLTRFPWPLDKGDKLRAYHQLRLLSRNHEICLVALSDTEVSGSDVKELKRFCTEVHVFPLSRAGILARMAKAVFKKEPFQSWYFYSDSINKQVEKCRNAFHPDIEYYQLLRSALYARSGKAPRVLDYMDALSEGMRKRAGQSGFLPAILWRLESKRLKKFESEIYPWFKSHIAISAQDADAMDLPGKVAIVPNGTDLAFFSASTGFDKNGPVVFHGNMSYPPNEQAAGILVNEIMPLVRRQIPEKVVLISGASPSGKVKSLASPLNKVTGWVDNILDVFNGASVFIAPFKMGTGLQNKLLEAMAAGIPCITSPLAANAFGAKNEIHLLTAESAEEYALQAMRLHNDPELASTVVRNASELVSKFSWEEQVLRLEHLFEATVAR